MANNIILCLSFFYFLRRNQMNITTTKQVSNGLNNNKMHTLGMPSEEAAERKNTPKNIINTKPGSDALSSTPTVELFNNYNKVGVNCSCSNQATPSDENLPQWLKNMLNNSAHNLDWIVQITEDAGVDKSQIPNLREMRQQEREMFRQMLKEQAEAAKALAESIAEEAKMQRKMLEAFKEIVQGQNPSPEGQQMLAQFAPMLLFIALLMKNDNETDEESIKSDDDESNEMAAQMQVSDKSEDEAA
jgi:RNA-binding protein YhbY